MKSIIKKVVAIIVVLATCLGVIGEYTQNVYAGAYRPSDQPDDTVTTRYTVLLLDVEGGFSMIQDGEEIYKVETPVEEVKQAAKKFVEQMFKAEGNNHIAIIAYGADSKVICNFSDDKTVLYDKIDKINSMDGFADIREAMLKAEEILDNVSEKSGSKNIVHFTQGVDGVGDEYFTEGQYSIEDCSWYNMGTNIHFYQYSNATYKTFETIQEKYNIYSIGLFKQLEYVPKAGKPVLVFAKKFAEDIQNKGYQEVFDIEDLEFAFGIVAEDITIKPTSFKFNGAYDDGEDTEYICYYSDTYFMQDADVYNEHLATMSLCLELTTWGTESSGAEYTDIIEKENTKYKNTRDLLDKLEFEDFAINEFWESKPTTDSIGVIAANKMIDDGDCTLIAIAIRGGNYGLEWASNFTVGEKGQHAGFSEAKKNTIDFLNTYITDNNITGNVKLWIVGYSRAGAVANLTAEALSYNRELLGEVKYDRNDVYAYTFEAPQGALAEETKYGVYSNIHNTINENDLIPLVAPSAWGFDRFNRDKILPSYRNTGNYSDKLSNMQMILEDINPDIDYRIVEKWSQDIPVVDYSAILPGGEPFLYSKEIEIVTKEAIEQLVDFIATDVVESRENYYNTYEELVRNIVVYVKGKDKSLLDDVFWQKVAEMLTYEELLNMVSPMYDLRYQTKPLKIAKMQEKVIEFLTKVIVELERDYGDECTETLSTLANLFVDVLYSALNETSYENIAEFVSTIYCIVLWVRDSLFQPHKPEFVLAWVASQDSFYVEGANAKVGRTYRVLHINCPVDVYVYSDNSGEVVASIVDNEPQEIEGSYILAYLNEDGEKIIVLPADTNYNIVIEATGNGVFNYTIDEYSYDEQGNTRVVCYYNIEIVTGDTFSASVPALIEDELYSENLLGSTSLYTLTNSKGEVLSPDNEVKGETALNANFDVNISKGNDFGYVLGGGTYSVGSFAQVKATPMIGGEFLGWYNGTEFISGNEVYRFAVKEDTDLVAMFSEVDLYEVNFVSQEGGTVSNIPLTVAEGVKIFLEAEPMMGYEFDCWLSDNNGNFENINDNTTTYVMGNKNTTITACFKKIVENEEEIIVLQPDNQENDLLDESVSNISNDELKNDMDKQSVDPNTGDKNTKVICLIVMLFSIISVSFFIKRSEKGVINGT